MISSQPHTHTNFNIKACSYGNYYNWYSATAGYGVYSSTNEPTEGDLCPAGWQLPYAGNDNYKNIKGSFYYLANQMDAIDDNYITSNRFSSFPNNYVLSSHLSTNGVVYNLGNYAKYASTIALNNNSIFTFNLEPDKVLPGTTISYYNMKAYSIPIRCVTGL